MTPLVNEERLELVSREWAAAYKQPKTHILSLSGEYQADGPMKGEEIARALKAGIVTVQRGQCRFQK